jgi:hypothetical protein
VVNWLKPQNVKQLRRFLGLTSYYKRFIKGYGLICKPLTQLLRNDVFVWNIEAVEAFKNIKEIMTQPLVLALPNLNKVFVI